MIFLFGIIFIGGLSITFLLLNLSSIPIWEIKTEVTVGTILVLADCVLYLALAYVFAPIFIGEYLEARKRKEFPIQERV